MISRRNAIRHRPEPGPKVMPGAESFRAGSGETAVLLCHGFTGSPASMRPWAQYLADRGYRVAVPLLPGHGTHWRDLNLTEWTDWYACVEQEFNVLRRECRQVFVAGMSMGGALSLRLAQRYGADVAGLMLVNPAIASRDRAMRLLPVLSRVIASIKGIGNDIARGGDEIGYPRTPLKAANSMTHLWADVRNHLGRVDQPILLCTSRIDHVVDPSSAEAIEAGVSSTELERVHLERSYHVATLDHDDELIFRRSAEFLARHTEPA
ncbi:alpha/beta hydrolase [Enemella sp. A6]|uniref:alpha/beta hydrolase n=1 Tax=Enemella sp. A6 TaxID=3440152 RepID=UPI003EB94B7D